MSEAKVKVVIADAQYLIRFALKAVISGLSHLDVVDTATDEEELLELVQSHAPDLVIMDYYEEGFSLSSIQQIKLLHKDCRIIVISADDHKQNIYQSLEMGINGFLTKSCDEAEIKDAIKAAIRDEKYFCAKVLDYLLEKSFGNNTTSSSSNIPLTSRQIEIVQLIAKGLVAKEIAALLNLSPHTIYTHRKKIMKTLQLRTSSELVLYALQNGLVEKS